MAGLLNSGLDEHSIQGLNGILDVGVSAEHARTEGNDFTDKLQRGPDLNFEQATTLFSTGSEASDLRR